MKDPLMQCTNCGKDIIEECECDHPQVNVSAPSAQQRPEVSSSEWVDALLKRWRGELRGFSLVGGEYATARKRQLESCIQDVERAVEGASTEPGEPLSPATQNLRKDAESHG